MSEMKDALEEYPPRVIATADAPADKENIQPEDSNKETTSNSFIKRIYTQAMSMLSPKNSKVDDESIQLPEITQSDAASEQAITQQSDEASQQIEIPSTEPSDTQSTPALVSNQENVPETQPIEESLPVQIPEIGTIVTQDLPLPPPPAQETQPGAIEESLSPQNQEMGTLVTQDLPPPPPPPAQKSAPPLRESSDSEVAESIDLSADHPAKSSSDAASQVSDNGFSSDSSEDEEEDEASSIEDAFDDALSKVARPVIEIPNSVAEEVESASLAQKPTEAPPSPVYDLMPMRPTRPMMPTRPMTRMQRRELEIGKNA